MAHHTRLAVVAAFGGLGLLLGSLTGCSARPPRTPATVDAGPARATSSADPVRKTVRPIPEVITKPKPFRVPDTIGRRGPSLVEPLTMASALPHSAPATAPGEGLEFPDVPAARPAAERPAVAEVRAMMQSYLQAFNRHDAAELAAHWSSSGENLDLDSGEKTVGREAVADVFTALFADDDAATIDIDVTAIKPLRDDVALVDGVSLIAFNDATTASSRFSAVAVREDGRWVLASVREAAAPVPAAARQPLEQLDWLVGSWEDVGEGLTASTQCFWSAGRAFLVRSHVITPDASAASSDSAIPALLPTTGAAREISEIIGWDPDMARIRSWVFTSDGRFAEGFWSRSGDTWTVRFEGRGSDAGAIGRHTLTRLGADEIVVRGDASPLADALPPASDFVRTAFLGE